MTKKILTVILIVLGCALLFVVGSALFLFLVPGAELFGIRYVTVGQGKYELAEQKMETFEKDIYIETTEVPVYISYGLITNVMIEFKQDFVGFTKSDYKTPSIEYKVEDENLKINTKELIKFFYSHERGDGASAYLKVYIPIGFEGKSIYINSNSSSIDFNAASSNLHQTVSIKTSGSVNIENSLNTYNLEIKTDKDLLLDENVKASNIKLETGVRKVDVLTNVSGTLDITAGAGDVSVMQAGNLVFKSTSGSLKAIKEKMNSFGSVNIETKSGKIDIDSITGDSISTIKSVSGDIELGVVKNINIECSRGQIVIDSVNSAKIIGGIGSVTVNDVINTLDINTRNGYVYLGNKDGATINNPKVYTVTGKIDAKNVFGIIDFTSTHNSVSVDCGNVTNVAINSGSYVNAYNLAGEVLINSTGSVDSSVKNLSGNINISTGDSCTSVTLKLLSTSLESFNYHFKSTKSKTVNLYAGDDVVENSKSEIKKAPYLDGAYEVVINTTYADMYIYTA